MASHYERGHVVDGPILVPPGTGQVVAETFPARGAEKVQPATSTNGHGYPRDRRNGFVRPRRSTMTATRPADKGRDQGSASPSGGASSEARMIARSQIVSASSAKPSSRARSSRSARSSVPVARTDEPGPDRVSS